MGLRMEGRRAVLDRGSFTARVIKGERWFIGSRDEEEDGRNGHVVY